MRDHRKRSTARAALAGACLATLLLCLYALTPAAALAAEEETHVFNATLSLTGNCSTSTADPAADPGLCPMPPGVAGVDHPNAAFASPKGIAVDPYGDRYVSSFGPEFAKPNQGRIDVFGPDGTFITEIADHSGPKAIAVDAKGNLYVIEYSDESEGANPESRLVRFKPTVYEPEAGDIEYGTPPVVVDQPKLGGFPPVGPGVHIYHNASLAIDPLTEGLLVGGGVHFYLFSSAADDNAGFAEKGNTAELGAGTTLAVDGAHKRIYAEAHPEGTGENLVKVYDLETFKLLETIDGSTTPAGKFLGAQSEMAVAAEEATGHVFVGDLGAAKKVYELEADGGYVSTIAHSFQYLGWRQIVVDNSPKSPTYRYLFVESGEAVPGHSYAFEPISSLSTPPVVESVSADGVTEDEASLEAKIDPEGAETSYRIEYTTQLRFEEEGFAGAVTAGEGTLGAGSEGVLVSAPVAGLSPGTAYRMRVLANSEGGEDEAQSTFSTYARGDASVDCENQAFRTGASAALPDCRAYELVTPANTGGLAPISLGFEADLFTTQQASADGNALSFQIQGGTIPGLDGTGSVRGDAYLVTRHPEGWSTVVTDADGTEASTVLPGSHSPDQGFAVWEAEGKGSKVIDGQSTAYLRYPDGHSELLGRGSLGTDPEAVGDLIAKDGRHVIFNTTSFSHVPLKLEPEAPPQGTQAIYDRTIDPLSGAEETHVISLLPHGETPQAGESATYYGASLDGRGVAFSIGSTLYLHAADGETYEIGQLPSSGDTAQQIFEKVTFEGVAEGGERLLYLQDGDLYSFDAATEARTAFTESGDVTVVNVSPDGGAAYFVSPSAIAAAGQNPNHAEPTPGAENLYLSREGTISFLGTLTKRDVLGKPGNIVVDGLGLWADAVGLRGAFAIDPSRATANGAILLFESRAKLTAYDPEGHAEVYRYDAEAPGLRCLSCVPTGVPASGEASLQSVKQVEDAPEPLERYSPVDNLAPDGQRAIFQSTEALVLADTDGVQDVYEWEEEGVGSCRSEGGCVYLISSGTSGRPTSGEPNYLYAASEDGRDVFLYTGDLLLPAEDPDETPSIYDARVEGGFPPPRGSAGECLGEACQPAAQAPGDPVQSLKGAGNVASEAPRARCPKGKRAVRRDGKVRCQRRHAKHKKHRHRRAGAKRGARR